MPFLPENLLEPISAESPCGEPASSQKNYEKLRDARKPNEAALEAFMAPRPEGTPRIMTRDMWAPREPNKLIEMLVDLLITKSKDLELAVWLSETLLWRHGLAGFHEGLLLVRGLLERYWDSLHPLPEEGDLYMRIRHLEWIGMTESSKDSSPSLAIGFVAVTQNGLTLNQFTDARGVPSEADAGQSQSGADRRSEAMGAGKTTPEEFDQGFDATPKAFYKELRTSVAGCRATIEELDEFCRERFTPRTARLHQDQRRPGESRKRDSDPASPQVGQRSRPGGDGCAVRRRPNRRGWRTRCRSYPRRRCAGF